MSTRKASRLVLPLLVALLVLALMTPTSTVFAQTGCETYQSNYDAGKTPEGFSASATDGCHTVRWTSNTTDVTGSGILKFKTMNPAIQPGESEYSLPGPQGGNYCQYRAAHEANLFMTNRFRVPVGTEVTVSYRCY